MNRKFKNLIGDIDWNYAQSIHDSKNIKFKDLAVFLECSFKTIANAQRLGLIKNNYKVILSDETKLKMSISKKEFYKNNPEKHNWRKNNKLISVPCEYFKNILLENKIPFLPEHEPLYPERYFSIDISFPDKKIGIEINGNQHYDNNGNLTQYYQNRHDLLEKSGWKIHEIHFLNVYNESFIKDFINYIKENIGNISDYELYKKREAVKYNCKHCGKATCYKSYCCRSCSSKLKQKFEIEKEKLEELISTHFMVDIGKMFNVSDNAIRKRCIKLGINLNKVI